MSLENKIVTMAEAIGADVRELNSVKVDKVAGKGLSDTNFTQTEKTKLSGVATGATKNRSDTLNADKSHTHTTSQITGLDTALGAKASKTELTTGLELKVDKVDDKGLSTEDYTTTEKDKLFGIEAGATKNRLDSKNADKVHTHTTSQITGLDAALGSKASKTELTNGLALKVDKQEGKGLSDTNFTQVEKTKLSGVAVGATKNATDAQLRDRATHTGEQPISTVKSLQSTLDSKVDKIAGKGLSTSDFTPAEKAKLASLESSKFVGLFVSESALPTTGSAGDYANVDGGVGSDVYRVIWDTSDKKWVRVQGVSTELTPAQIKQQYEGNPDTNAFTDADKAKLAGIATGATKNRADPLNADKIHKHVIADVTGLDAALLTKFDKADIEQTTGTATDKVMSQKAVTDNLDSLGVELELLRQELNKLKDSLPIAIGDERWGGFYIGDITIPDGDDAGTYMVIMAGEEGEASRQWKLTESSTASTTDENNGKLNTLAMVNAGIGEHPAGEYCVNYRGGGYDDWYLPAINEVVLVWINRALLGDFEIVDGIFWSSNQTGDAEYARSFKFRSAAKSSSSKTDLLKVRPVRRIKKE